MGGEQVCRIWGEGQVYRISRGGKVYRIWGGRGQVYKIWGGGRGQVYRIWGMKQDHSVWDMAQIQNVCFKYKKKNN